MTLRTRLTLLLVLVTVLPALPALWVTRQLTTQSLRLGLSPETSAAMEAGLRQARSGYRLQADALDGDVARWLATIPEPDASAVITTLNEAVPSFASGVTVFPPEGDPTHFGARVPRVDGDAAPTAVIVDQPLADGGRVRVERAVIDGWTADATALADAMQTLRALELEQTNLEGRFWRPFAVIYGAAVLIAGLLAVALARGVTGPVAELVRATESVARGRWDVRIDRPGRDEIGQLGSRFNRMVDALDAQSRQLVDLEKMTGWREMARALAHEVKNPLTPIALTVEEMRARYRGSDDEYRSLLDECTRIVVGEVESLRDIVTRFREFSRPVAPRWSEVDLNALVADVAALQRDMEVETDLDPDVGTYTLDPDRLRQALLNLTANARAAMAGMDAPRLRVATRATPNGVRIVLEDSGPGIPSDERERIFEPYRSGSADGLGLGLTLVKGIVLAHGGSIEVDVSSLGGARFDLHLPHRTPEEAADV